MIDVSEYQGRIDWGRVRGSGVTQAYLKATEGRTLVDSRLARNVREARKHGIAVGCYHFAHPSSPPRLELRHFLATIAPLARVGDLPPALDLELAEGLTVEELEGWKAHFLAGLDEAIGLHDGAAFYSYLAFLGRLRFSPGRPIWGAAYVPAGSAWKPPPGWFLWQHSSSGRVPGIGGRVDLDRPLAKVRRLPHPLA